MHRLAPCFVKRQGWLFVEAKSNRLLRDVLARCNLPLSARLNHYTQVKEAKK
jgi:hypothetical protein